MLGANCRAWLSCVQAGSWLCMPPMTTTCTTAKTCSNIDSMGKAGNETAALSCSR